MFCKCEPKLRADS
jgi:CAAX protease family protein